MTAISAETAVADVTSTRGRRLRRLVGGAAGLLAILALVNVVPDIYTNVVSRAAIYGIVALSMNIIVGYTGQVSLGHAAFVGVGAFGAGYTLTELAMPYLAALLVAALTGAIGALILGAVALRVTGLYLALVTIAYGLMAQETLFNIRSLTGGGAGLSAARPSFFETDHRYAGFCIGMLLLALVFDWRLVSSRAGRAIQALRDDERVAASWGINVTGYKLAAFVMSGVLAGVAGALFASTEQIVSKEDFPLSLSITFLLMTVVGGVGNRWGVVSGGVLFATLPTLLDRAHANFHFFPFSLIEATWEPAIGALLLLLTLISFPGGLVQQAHFVLEKVGLRESDGKDAGAGMTSGGGIGARP
ncbi:branched-chain amino acid ABC transporter permease [Actinospongicola halichondriae]|uniref:branched-chain amino acid ABC transporter permease n=1 Tax=Actinospongicola halichondriae TaxID=3236844 RepID=UPI003D4E278B